MRTNAMLAPSAAQAGRMSSYPAGVHQEGSVAQVVQGQLVDRVLLGVRIVRRQQTQAEGVAGRRPAQADD